MNDYAIARLPTPVLNTPHFSDVFRCPLPLDAQNLLRPVETIALPGTKFQIESTNDSTICKVTTNEYGGSNLYVDRRFLDFTPAIPVERVRTLSSKATILANLRAREHLPYVWGGNWGLGIQEMLTFYPPSRELDAHSQAMWTFKGLDCSGLLYEATGGFTPRNTSQLVRFGKSVLIAGLESHTIGALLQPLDLIVWSGHVIIVEDSQYVIESKNPVGVVRTSLQTRLREVMQEKQPVDDWDTTLGQRFVIRRWINRL